MPSAPSCSSDGDTLTPADLRLLAWALEDPALARLSPRSIRSLFAKACLPAEFAQAYLAQRVPPQAAPQGAE